MLNKSDLRSYQIRLVKEIIEKKKLLLAVDMGLGKTISCLTAIEELKNDVKKVLIVAPKRVAQVTWPDEIKNWEHLKDLTYTIIKGTEKQRLECLKEDTLIYIVNRELTPWLIKNIDFNFDTVIYDESSSLKSGKTRTSSGELSRFGAICKITENAKIVLLLTGTPTPNGIQDLYGQIKVLEPKNKDIINFFGKSKNQFLEKFFKNVSRVRNYAIWRPLENTYEKIIDFVSEVVIKMKSEDYLELPDFLSLDINIELDKKDMILYKKLKDDYISEDEQIIASNPAVLLNKLLQLCTGCVYLADKTYNIYHEHKIEYLKELIEENEDENILLFYNYKHEKEQLEKNFKNIVFFKKDEDLKKWNDGKIKLFACHPASAGHGLNFQKGGNVMIWTSLPWSLELYQQANKRLHRSGQKNHVKCYHLLCKNTAEYQVYQALKDKDATQEKIFNLIKNL